MLKNKTSNLKHQNAKHQSKHARHPNKNKNEPARSFVFCDQRGFLEIIYVVLWRFLVCMRFVSKLKSINSLYTRTGMPGTSTRYACYEYDTICWHDIRYARVFFFNQELLGFYGWASQALRDNTRRERPVACVCTIRGEATREENAELFSRKKMKGRTVRSRGEGGAVPAM